MPLNLCLELSRIGTFNSRFGNSQQRKIYWGAENKKFKETSEEWSVEMAAIQRRNKEGRGSWILKTETRFTLPLPPPQIFLKICRNQELCVPMQTISYFKSYCYRVASWNRDELTLATNKGKEAYFLSISHAWTEILTRMPPHHNFRWRWLRLEKIAKNKNKVTEHEKRVKR